MKVVSVARCFLPPRSLLAAVLLVLSGPPLLAVQLVPGVFGYGLDRSINPAGFGATSTVIEVTNLNDSGAGSLRAAVQASGSRVVVFRTSGVITLASDLVVTNGNLTIAGQTAPSPGISIHGATLNVKANNVLIQHLRVRPGDSWAGPATGSRDGVKASSQGNAPTNVVFDHCTVNWSLDEIASTWYDWDNVTFNRCLFAEPLHHSIHLDENTFSPNVPQQAESLANTKSGFTTTSTASSSFATDGTYQLVSTDGTGDYIEYTLNVVSRTSTRPDTHVVIVGVKGSDRGTYRVEVRDGANNVLLNSAETVDLYSASGAQHTYVTQQTASGGFTIPSSTNATTPLKVRLIITGKNASSSNYKLGIDLISLSEGHGFGPLFSSGNPAGGKLAMTGCIIAHAHDRGPWSAAKQFYFANNINYDRGWLGLHLGHSSYPQAYAAAIVGNSFIDGASTSTSISLPNPIANTSTPAGSQLYVGTTADNVYNSGDNPNPPAMVGSGLSPYLVGTDPTVKTAGLAGVVPLSPAAAYQAALDYAGARPADRDTVETRIISEIAQGAAITALASRPGSLKHSVAGAGGWPAYAVNTATWTLPVNPNADDSSAGYPAGNGYTNIEEWLQALAQQVEGVPIDPPVAKFDDFEDGNANGWISDGGAWSVTASSPFVYQQTDNTQPAVRSLLTGTNWTDQVVEADATAVSFNGTNRFFGVVARYVDSLNYYYFILRSNNTLELKALVAGTSSTIAGPLTFTVNTGTRYTLALEVIGTSVKGYVNGVLQLSGTASNFASGRCGLLTYFTHAQFDNVLADPNPGAVNAPGALTATVAAAPNNISQIDLTWTNVPNETGYKIERKRGAGGTYAEIATTGTDVTSYSDTTCGAGTQYFYRVRATNAAGDSVYSPEANATTAEVTSGRQAHWKFDEGTGTTAADSSGNANTGTLGASPATPAWTTGKIGSALNFDAVDDVVAAGSGASLDDLPALTITAWIKPNTVGEGASPGRIVHKGTGTTATNGWQFVTQTTNAISFSVDFATTNINHVSANNAITMGAWQHVAVTWTGSALASTIKLYVNGVETSYGTTTDGAGARVSDAVSSVFIGNDNAGSRTFDGTLDDVRVYNRVLTTAELQAIYRAGL